MSSQCMFFPFSHLVPFTMGQKAGTLGPGRMSAFSQSGRPMPVWFMLLRSCSEGSTALMLLKSSFTPLFKQKELHHRKNNMMECRKHPKEGTRTQHTFNEPYIIKVLQDLCRA